MRAIRLLLSPHKKNNRNGLEGFMSLVGTRFVCALALGAIICGSAAAQVTPEQQSALRANCRSDFMSKCSGVTPGGKEALTCLQTHVSTLSAGCKAAVSATLPKPAPAVAAPAPPPVVAPPAAKVETPAPVPAPSAATQPAVQTSPQPATVAKPAAPKVAKPAPPKPAQAKPGQPKPAAPPPQTASAPPTSITPPPPSAGPVDAAVMLRACKLDLVRYCGNSEIGEGRKLACLNENASRLTIRCRTALKVTAPIR
jgi:hypothetical protein